MKTVQLLQHTKYGVKLILASGSVGRKMLLESLKIPFEIMESSVDEEKIQDEDPIKLATLRAIAKAEEVAKKIQGNWGNQGNGGNEEKIIVIGADTVGFLDNPPVGEARWVFGKPKSREEAEEMMRKLSGKTHKYVSAHAIIKLETLNSEFEKISGYDVSSVTFRRLSAIDIKTYLDRVEFLKLCGAFKINDSPQDFVTRVEGSISNIIGLSLEKIIPILRKEGLLTIGLK